MLCAAKADDKKKALAAYEKLLKLNLDTDRKAKAEAALKKLQAGETPKKH